MVYESLSLVELKRLAKTRKIKQYYIMKKDELLELLQMDELPFKYKLEKMTITELREEAKNRGMRGFWGLSKDALTELLFPTRQDKHEDDGKTGEHQNPENEDPNNVWVKTPEDSFEEGSNNLSLDE